MTATWVGAWPGRGLMLAAIPVGFLALTRMSIAAPIVAVAAFSSSLAATPLQPLPAGPVKSGDEKLITLVPYCVTKFRISMFPVTQKTLAAPDAP